MTFFFHGFDHIGEQGKIIEIEKLSIRDSDIQFSFHHFKKKIGFSGKSISNK